MSLYHVLNRAMEFFVPVMLMRINWQKCKSTFLTCHCHEIYREAVGLKKFQLYLKNNNFCEYVKFGAISLKIDILLITA